MVAHTHLIFFCGKKIPSNPETVFCRDAPVCLWDQSVCNDRRWGCWLETPRDDLARAPDHFNHSSLLTGSQLSICSQESRHTLTNHLPSLLLPAPHFCLSAMMTQWKKTVGRKKIWDWFICLLVLKDGPLSLFSFPFFLPFLCKLKPISRPSTCSGECRASEE